MRNGPWMSINGNSNPDELRKIRSVDGKKPRGVEVDGNGNRIRLLFSVSEYREPSPIQCFYPLHEYCWDGTP
jgi:hypothetical protein